MIDFSFFFFEKTLRTNESSNSSNDDIIKISSNDQTINYDEVLYRNPTLLSGKVTEISNEKIRTDCVKNNTPKNINEHNKKLTNINACRGGLQRKLELKVEKVKKTLNAAQLKPNENNKYNQIIDLNVSTFWWIFVEFCSIKLSF